ncbi:MAG: hypothetical protein NTW69_12055 [Chloroflexi bacterium]|nr:hypothetical protein [Chloroflexota bacterium]
MSTKIDNQLVQVYIQEAMQNAARSRADRSSQPARTKINGRESLLALIAAGVPIAIWLVQVFKTR